MLFPLEESLEISERNVYHRRIKSVRCAMFHRKLNSSSIYYTGRYNVPVSCSRISPRIALFRKALYRKMAERVWKRINDRDFHASMFRRTALGSRSRSTYFAVCLSSFSACSPRSPWPLIPRCVSQVDNARKYGIIEPADFVLHVCSWIKPSKQKLIRRYIFSNPSQLFFYRSRWSSWNLLLGLSCLLDAYSCVLIINGLINKSHKFRVLVIFSHLFSLSM